MSALNFDDDEKRTDVHFNKALKTEAPSAYYFGINKDADPLNLDQETGVRKRFEEKQALLAIKAGKFPKDKKKIFQYKLQYIMLNNLNQVRTLH